MNYEFSAIAWTVTWVVVDILAIAAAIRIRRIDRNHFSSFVLVGAIAIAISHVTDYACTALMVTSSADPSSAVVQLDTVILVLKLASALGLAGSALFVGGIFVLSKTWMANKAGSNTQSGHHGR